MSTGNSSSSPSTSSKTSSTGSEKFIPDENIKSIPTIKALWEYCATKYESSLQTLEKLNEVCANNSLNENKPIIKERCDAIRDAIKQTTESSIWDYKYLGESPSNFFKSWLLSLKPEGIRATATSYRDIYEKLGAGKQCEYAEKGCGSNPTNWNICYICGLDFKILSLGTPECEHILAAFVAIGVHGLIGSSTQLTPEDIDFYRYEYAWSHRCCNQLKSDLAFLRFTRKNYEIDVNKIRSFLENVWDNTMNPSKYDCGFLRATLLSTYKNKSAFVGGRITYITNTYLRPLLAKMNGSYMNLGEAYLVEQRARQLNSVSISIENTIAALVSGKEAYVPEIKEKLIKTAHAIKLIDITLSDYSSRFVDVLIEKLTRRTEGMIDTTTLKKEKETRADANVLVITTILTLFGITRSPRDVKVSIKRLIEDPRTRGPTGNELIQLRNTVSDKLKTLFPSSSTLVKESELYTVINKGREEMFLIIQAIAEKILNDYFDKGEGAKSPLSVCVTTSNTSSSSSSSSSSGVGRKKGGYRSRISQRGGEYDDDPAEILNKALSVITIPELTKIFNADMLDEGNPAQTISDVITQASKRIPILPLWIERDNTTNTEYLKIGSTTKEASSYQIFQDAEKNRYIKFKEKVSISSADQISHLTITEPYEGVGAAYGYVLNFPGGVKMKIATAAPFGGGRRRRSIRMRKNKKRISIRR